MVQLKPLIPGGRTGLHPLVELHALLDPLVVERLRWLIQHQLEGGKRFAVLTGDLQEPAAPPGRLPEALAIPAHVAPLGRALLLGDHLPGRNTGKDQAALRLPPEEGPEGGSAPIKGDNPRERVANNMDVGIQQLDHGSEVLPPPAAPAQVAPRDPRLTASNVTSIVEVAGWTRGSSAAWRREGRRPKPVPPPPKCG